MPPTDRTAGVEVNVGVGVAVNVGVGVEVGVGVSVALGVGVALAPHVIEPSTIVIVDPTPEVSKSEAGPISTSSSVGNTKWIELVPLVRHMNVIVSRGPVYTLDWNRHALATCGTSASNPQGPTLHGLLTCTTSAVAVTTFPS